MELFGLFFVVLKLLKRWINSTPVFLSGNVTRLPELIVSFSFKEPIESVKINFLLSLFRRVQPSLNHTKICVLFFCYALKYRNTIDSFIDFFLKIHFKNFSHKFFVCRLWVTHMWRSVIRMRGRRLMCPGELGDSPCNYTNTSSK